MTIRQFNAWIKDKMSLSVFVGKYWRWGAILLIIVLSLGLWLIPKWQIRDSGIDKPGDRFVAENEARKTLAQIVGGAALLLGLYFTWQTVQSRWKDVKLTEEGQITERFTRAIDQLGSDKLEVRLGGIYALERIAKDSPKDHWPIMEVLTAYVRENAPWPSKKEVQLKERLDRPVLDTSLPSPIEKEINKPKADIQAIMTVLRRRNWTTESKKTDRVDLRSTDLSFVVLQDANLSNAILFDTNLETSLLLDANLEGAFLPGANLKNAFLNKANLRYAVLEKSNLQGAELERANFEEADLNNADLKGVDLRSAIGLTRDQIDSAETDDRTQLPESLKTDTTGKPR
ncbi:pentapeptide repeat-containing protein [Desulfobacterota bacterium AH_259_B03_O07]|nr:pentapeptide repeat-containing protein [Desulfobacterota bacterium AH_259_B03_O07]